MNKRSLMLSAAVAALLSTPATADTSLSTVATQTQKTSVTGNLTINAAGGINFKSATDPLLNIDSSNQVISNGLLTMTDQTTATGVLINAAGLVGSFQNNAGIDLSGTGINKKAVYIQGTSFFTGPIQFGTNSLVNVVGDQSFGLLMDSTATLNGDISMAGTLTVSQSSPSSTDASGIAAMAIQGTVKGNILFGAGTTIGAIGAGGRGVVIGGSLQHCDITIDAACTSIGSFINGGTIIATGIVNRSATTTNPESGSAVVIAGNLAGGFLNNGLVTPGDAVNSTGVISGNGVPSALGGSTILIGSTTNTAVTLGTVTGDANGAYGFINRGNVVATPLDNNVSTRAILIGGSGAAATTTIMGGVFNSGSITAQASSATGSTASGVVATALEIDAYAIIPEIRVSGQSFVGGAGRGIIAASISGPVGGTATAIDINALGSAANGTIVPSIVIEANAQVLASATVPDAATAVPQGFLLSAVAIHDQSNSLASIVNAGVISASATTLSNGFTSTAQAVNAQNNTTALSFINSGTVVGAVLFGAGSDTYLIAGANPNAFAIHNGTISFGLSNANGGLGDSLHVGQFANVAGTISATGTLDVEIDATGTLTVQNVGSTLATRNFTVAGGSGAGAGTVNITVSQGVGAAGVIQANTVDFGLGANLGVEYGSFIPLTGTSTSFVLLSALTTQLHIDPADVARYSASVGSSGTLPFLFQSAVVAVVPNVSGRDQLVLTITPKNQAALGLTGYGAAVFAPANAAVAADNTLGAALISGVTAANVQQTYDAFAPDVSGGTRAIAISLTDQATGSVAARQRTLRLFAKSPGELTLWGNEFGQYISTHGGTGGGVVGGAVTSPGVVNGFKDRGFGFSLGLDEGSPESGWYGLAFSFFTGDVAETDNRVLDKSSSLWYMLTGYSTWRGRGFFVDTQASVAISSIKGKRFLSLPQTGGTTFLREADNKHAGLLGALGVTMGAQFNYGSFHVIPQFSLDGMTMREEGYTETGGGNGFNLKVAPIYANSLRLFFGSEFRQDLNLGDFYIQPSAKLGYRYDLMGDPIRLRGQFADIDPSATVTPGSIFLLQGPNPSRGAYVAGANLNATTDNWTIGLNYDFVRGSHNETEQVGTISLLGRI